MSDYVPDQDPFAEFTHEGDWLRDVHGADGTCPNDGDTTAEDQDTSKILAPQTLRSDETSFNPGFKLDELDRLFLEDFNPLTTDLNFGKLLDTAYSHEIDQVPAQRSSNAMLDLASESQTVGLANQHISIGNNESTLPATKPLSGGLVERTAARTTRKKDAYNTNLFCDFPGCPVKEAFRRPFELNRHMSKHTRDASYGCPVVACNRSGNRAFYREDKLKAHLRSVHDDAEQSSCPVPSCNKGPMQLDLLRVHMRIHNDDEASEVLLLKLYAAETRRCPLEKCRTGSSRWMYSDKIPGPNGHLLAHDQAERQDQQASISAKGYDATSGSIVCPICRQLCPGNGEFRVHLSDVHMTGTEHARLYAAAVRNEINRQMGDKINMKKYEQWSIWDDLPLALFSSGSKFEFKCPGCSVTITDRPGHFGCKAVDHPGLIMATEELFRYRREILRLLPDFYAHPVFEDVRRTW